MYIYTYINKCTCKNIWLYIYIYTYTCMCKCICIYIYWHICSCTDIFFYIYIYTHSYIDVYIHIYIYLYMYMYIWLGHVTQMKSNTRKSHFTRMKGTHAASVCLDQGRGDPHIAVPCLWHNHTCDMTHLYVRHHMCDRAVETPIQQRYAWDTAPWLIHICDKTHFLCDMTRVYVWQGREDPHIALQCLRLGKMI